MHVVRHRLQQRVGEQRVEHRRLVDDQQVALQRVVGVAQRLAAGAHAEQAVEGLRRLAGQLGQPLGRPPGRRRQQRLAALGGQERDDRLGGRRLAHAGAAGQHADLAGERHLDRRPLRLGQGEAAPAGVPGERLGEVDLPEMGQPVGRRAQERRQPPDDAALGVEVGRQVEHVALVDLLAPGAVGRQQPLDRLAHLDLGDRQRLDAAPDQLVLRQEDVAVVGGLPEQVERRAHHPLRRVGREAELRGDLVGGLEADAVDLAGQAVRVVLDDADRRVAVALVDPHRQGGGDRVVGQEDHHLLDRALLLPGGADQPAAVRPQPWHLGQPLGLLVDHRQRLLAEAVDDPLGRLRPDPLDHPGAEVLADAVDGGGQDDAAALGDELPPVQGVAVPAPGQLDALADVDRRQAADDGDGVALARRLHLGDGVAVLRVDVGEPLDDARQLGRLRRRPPVLSRQRPLRPASRSLSHATVPAGRPALSLPL